MQVYRHQGGSPTTRLTLRRAGNLSRGHQDTRKTLKRQDTIITIRLYMKIHFTIFPHYSTALIISKNFHILSSFNVNQMRSHWVLFLLYLNIVLSWPEDGRSRPKHVAKYNLIVIIASCLDVCCVLTVHNTLYTHTSSFTLQYFPYYVWRSKYCCLL